MSGGELIGLVVIADALIWVPVFVWQRREWDLPMAMIPANITVISLNVLILCVLAFFR